MVRIEPHTPRHATRLLRAFVTSAVVMPAMAAMVALLASPVSAAGSSDAETAGSASTLAEVPGLRYERHVLEEPRPIRVHTLRIDLSEPALDPAVVLSEDPPEADRNATRTDPRRLAADPSVVAFVNANPWSPWGPDYPRRVTITGLAASGGERRSEPGAVSVWADDRGRVSVGDPGDAVVQEGVGGFHQLLDENEILVQPSDSVHPRTAIAVNEAGDRMWLVVVDGRQSDVSEGMSYHELAVFLSEHLDEDLGPWDAAAMDGGGSSVLGARDAQGELRILNSPSGGQLRPLPLIFTVRHSPSP